MLVFWILAAVMTAVALAFVLVPLLRTRAATGPSESEANLEVLRSHRREIDADVAAGTLPAEAREEVLAELVGRATDDLAEPPPPLGATRRAWGPAIAAAIAIPALAFGIYAAIGTPLATDPRVAAAARGTAGEHEVVAMVEQLALKMKERPDDAQGWLLLARSMAALERFQESADAYARVVKLAPGDAQVLADYADSLGMAQGRSLEGKPTELVNEALRLDPKHRKALALAGTAALDRGDLDAAAGYWRRLAAELPADSPDAQQVQAVLADIESRAAAGGRKLATGPAGGTQRAQAAPAVTPKAPAAPPVAVQAPAAGASVTGTVTLAPELAARMSGGETLFIFARAEGGPRTPLALVRGTARDLPMRFTLDDSLAMAPGFNISSAPAIRVEARLTRTGNATPQPGDLTGSSPVVKPGARDVKVVVDRVLP